MKNKFRISFFKKNICKNFNRNFINGINKTINKDIDKGIDKGTRKGYKNVRFITKSAAIAAVYVLLSVVFSSISYGQLQVRIAEALTVLPAYTSAAIPGLFVGCIVSNIIGGNGPLDIIFGSLATLIAAYLSYKMPKPYLVPLPPVVVNALVVGFILSRILEGVSFAIAATLVALGQTIACYGLGYLLMLQLKKFPFIRD